MSAPPPVAASALSAPPRWGVRTGLFQPRRPAFWLFVVLLIVGGLYALLVQLLALLSAAPGFALGWFLLLFYIVPVLLVVRWLDLYEREPASLMVGAFAWGGIVATSFSAFANDFWGYVIVKLAGAEVAALLNADLSDADLLVRPAPSANHIAWQLGHLIASERNLVEAAAPGST